MAIRGLLTYTPGIWTFLCQLHLAVVVAVVAVREVQVAGHQVIRVVAVRHGFVAAARSMLVAFLVAAAVVSGRATGGIGVADREAVFLHAFTPRMVQVALVQVIHMAIMLDARVSAVGSVLMLVSGVGAGHSASPSFKTGTGGTVPFDADRHRVDLVFDPAWLVMLFYPCC